VGAVGTTSKKVPFKLISYATGDKPNHKVQQHKQIRAMRVRGTITMTMTINQYAYCDDIVRVVRIGSHQKNCNYVEIKANANWMLNAFHLASCPNYLVKTWLITQRASRVGCGLSRFSLLTNNYPLFLFKLWFGSQIENTSKILEISTGRAWMNQE